MEEELKSKIRQALSENTLLAEWENLVEDTTKYQDDLSWIKAIRDECSAAIRRASNEEPLISRLLEFKLRQSTFNVIYKRDGQRAERSSIRAKLLGALYDEIIKHLPDKLNDSVRSELNAMIGLSSGDTKQVLNSGNDNDEQWDDVILIEGKTVTILGQRKMIIKQDPK